MKSVMPLIGSILLVTFSLSANAGPITVCPEGSHDVDTQTGYPWGQTLSGCLADCASKLSVFSSGCASAAGGTTVPTQANNAVCQCTDGSPYGFFGAITMKCCVSN